SPRYTTPVRDGLSAAIITLVSATSRSTRRGGAAVGRVLARRGAGSLDATPEHPPKPPPTEPRTPSAPPYPRIPLPAPPPALAASGGEAGSGGASPVQCDSNQAAKVSADSSSPRQRAETKRSNARASDCGLS